MTGPPRGENTTAGARMDRDEYERRVLIALAEVIELLAQIKFPSPMDGIGGKPRDLANELREAAYKYNRRRVRRT